MWTNKGLNFFGVVVVEVLVVDVVVVVAVIVVDFLLMSLLFWLFGYIEFVVIVLIDNGVVVVANAYVM